MFGYMGKLLFADLTAGKLWEEELTEEMAREYLGGYGFGVKVLLERSKPGLDAFDPESWMGIISSPLNGTGAFFGGRYMVVSKSPASKGWNDANSGGYFGPELKKAGFDGVFITGASEKPVYIWINDGKYELRDASELWGLDVKETEAKLKEITGEPRMRAAVIGPAGEHMSWYAAVMNDGHRAAGRGGTGGVMGSKKLKAVACRGTLEVPVADKAALMAVNREVADFIRNPPEQMAGRINGRKAFGTTTITSPGIMSGDSPVKNWGGSGIADYGGQATADIFEVNQMEARYNVKPFGCAACPIRCGAEYNVTDGRWPIGETDRPEYETWSAFGSNCLCKDVDAIIKCNDLCNRGGFDTISGGSVLAWVFECYEHGVLTKEDLDGIEAVWGSGEAMVALMQKVYDDEGCGKKIKLGQKGAADAFGKGHEYLAVANGVELGCHDSRIPGNGARIRVYQYDPTPGRHTKGGARGRFETDEEHGKADIAGAFGTEITNCSGLCSFSGMAFTPTTMNRMLSAVLGRDFTNEEAYTIGRRIHLSRLSYNIREGLTRDKMWISPRLAGQPPLATGPNSGVSIDNEKYGDLYFSALGCDLKTGQPSREALEAAGGLDHLVEYFYGDK